MTKGESFYDAVYRVVRMIPRGQVATYGQVAAILGHPRAARAVGYALHALRGGGNKDVPWQRVINAQGRISSKGDVVRAEVQQRKLEEEGIALEDGQVSLARCRWEGPTLTIAEASRSL